MLWSLREGTDGNSKCYYRLQKNGLDSLFKEVRVFKERRSANQVWSLLFVFHHLFVPSLSLPNFTLRGNMSSNAPLDKSPTRFAWKHTLRIQIWPPALPQISFERISVWTQVSNGTSYQGAPGLRKKGSHCNFQDFRSLSTSCHKKNCWINSHEYCVPETPPGG